MYTSCVRDIYIFKHVLCLPACCFPFFSSRPCLLLAVSHTRLSLVFFSTAFFPPFLFSFNISFVCVAITSTTSSTASPYTAGSTMIRHLQQQQHPSPSQEQSVTTKKVQSRRCSSSTRQKQYQQHQQQRILQYGANNTPMHHHPQRSLYGAKRMSLGSLRGSKSTTTADHNQQQRRVPISLKRRSTGCLRRPSVLSNHSTATSAQSRAKVS